MNTKQEAERLARVLDQLGDCEAAALLRSQAAEIERLKAGRQKANQDALATALELEALRADAARYRWLVSDKADGRNQPFGAARNAVYEVWDLLAYETPVGKIVIDEAIDAAMKQGETPC